MASTKLMVFMSNFTVLTALGRRCVFCTISFSQRRNWHSEKLGNLLKIFLDPPFPQELSSCMKMQSNMYLLYLCVPWSPKFAASNKPCFTYKIKQHFSLHVSYQVVMKCIPGVVVHTCNRSIHEGHLSLLSVSKATLSNTARPVSRNQKKKKRWGREKEWPCECMYI